MQPDPIAICNFFFTVFLCLTGAENTHEAFSGDHEDTTTYPMGAALGNVTLYLGVSVGKSQGVASTSDPESDGLPSWATIFLSLAIAFIFFMLAGLLFWIPYYAKVRQPSVVSCNSTPRCSM